MGFPSLSSAFSFLKAEESPLIGPEGPPWAGQAGWKPQSHSQVRHPQAPTSSHVPVELYPGGLHPPDDKTPRMSSDIQREARSQLEQAIQALGVDDDLQVDQEVVLRRAAPVGDDIRRELRATGLIEYWFKPEVDLLVRRRADAQPILAVEVDGRQHRTDPITIHGDRKKNALLAMAQVPLYRVERPDLSRLGGRLPVRARGDLRRPRPQAPA